MSAAIETTDGRVRLAQGEVPPAVEQRMLDVIASATAYGSWGSVCFLVESKADGGAYACVYADLGLLQASNAVGLVEHVETHSSSTLNDALKTLLGSKKDVHDRVDSDQINGNLPGPNLALRAGSRYVPMTNIAVTTLRAVIMFLQTGRIAFAPRYNPLGPEDQPSGTDLDETIAIMPEGNEGQGHGAQWSTTMQASAKSVYHAACRFSLDGLSDLAEAAIDSQVDATNILADLFSRFTLNHPAIRKKRLDFALAHWDEIKQQNRTGFTGVLLRYAGRSGAKEVIDEILQRTCIPTADDQ